MPAIGETRKDAAADRNAGRWAEGYPKMARGFHAPDAEWDGPYPLFTRISIETNSKCNRSCRFCPISAGRRDGPGKPMDPVLFSSICSQLAELGYDKFVEMYLLNEPMIDPGFLKKAEAVRKACPKATLYMSTNADVLDKRKDRDDLIRQVFASGINSVNVNIYDQGEEQAARYRGYVQHWIELGICRPNPHKYKQVPVSSNWIAVTDMRAIETGIEGHEMDPYYDRAFEDRSKPTRDTVCPLPARHLVIRYDGKVMPCCAVDPTHPSVKVMADVAKMPLVEAWNADSFARFRHRLRDGKRSKLAACIGCNYRNHMPMPFVRVKCDDPETLARWDREDAVELAALARARRAVGLPMLGDTQEEGPGCRQ